MILLYGCLSDPPMVRTLEAVQRAGAPYALLAQSALESEQLSIDADSNGLGGVLTCAGQRIDLSQFHSVYARPLELPSQTSTVVDPSHAQRLHEQLFDWLDVADALVVNRPRAMEANSSKPLQAQLIASSGFLVPHTLVTSDKEEARGFWRAHGRVVFKSISGIRSIVQELTDAQARRLHLLENLPVQFQAYVPGVDVRVHVVGERVFAAEIESPSTDYRYASRDGSTDELRAVELPLAVAGRCVALAHDLGLTFTGIDLRRRPDGEYVCFEANPMPAYNYFESETGLPIAEALASLLASGHGNVEGQMQAVDNLTVIRGTILSRRPHATLKDYDVATIKLEGSEPVPDKADLLKQLVGREVEVAVLRQQLGTAKAGQQLRCRAKRTPDGAMCEKAPRPGDFTIR